jgi:hypothetical protein
MLISIHLEDFLETELRLYSQHKGVALSEFVRKASCEKKEHRTIFPYELGKDFFGRYASGDSKRSTKRMIREKIHAQHLS